MMEQQPIPSGWLRITFAGLDGTPKKGWGESVQGMLLLAYLEGRTSETLDLPIDDAHRELVALFAEKARGQNGDGV